MAHAADTTYSAQEGYSVRREAALVPPDVIATRALVTVIAIMTFLAALTAGAALIVSEASQDWRQDVAREMTIQVKPTHGRDLEQDTQQAAALARKAAGVAEARALSKSESDRLLEPWLGGGSFGDLPVPRMIVLRLDPAVALDAARLRESLAQSVPGALVDDHKLWLARLAAMARSMVLGAILIFALVLVAMVLAVAFATRGAMAGSREVINVLHFVGAADRYIARQFQRHFLRLGLQGGFLGGGAAILCFLTAGFVTRGWTAHAGAEQVEALFGSFSLGLSGYVAILLIAAFVALLTGLTSRSVVFKQLRQLD